MLAVATPTASHLLLSCRPKIVDGRIQKFVAEQALLEQAFIKDTTKTVATVIKEAVATVGEKISIRRFERSAQIAPGFSHVECMSYLCWLCTMCWVPM